MTRISKLLVGAIACFGLAGCVGPSEDGPVHVAISEAFSAEETRAIERGLAQWSAASGRQLFVVDDMRGGLSLVVLPDSPADRLDARGVQASTFRDEERARVAVGPNARRSPEHLERVMAHEAGHALGLGHLPGRAAMGILEDDSIRVSEPDVRALAELRPDVTAGPTSR